jgi:hypothetical protein
MADDDGLRGSQYWKMRADESRARAEGMSAGEARVLMLRIVRMYDLLAVYATAREAQQNEPD